MEFSVYRARRRYRRILNGELSIRIRPELSSTEPGVRKLRKTTTDFSLNVYMLFFDILKI